MAFALIRRVLTEGPPLSAAFLSSNTATSGVASGISLGVEAEDRVIVALLASRSAVATALWINGIALPLYATANQVTAFSQIGSALIPRGDRGVVNIKAAGFTSAPVVHIYRLTGLASPVPRSVATSITAADTVRTVDVSSGIGGVILALAGNDVGAANQCTWTGDQSPTESADAAIGAGRQSAAHIYSTNDDTANTITATFDVISTTGISLAAAAFR